MRKKVFHRTEKEMFVCLKKSKPVLIETKTMNDRLSICGDDNSSSKILVTQNMHFNLPITQTGTKTKCRNLILLNPFTRPVQALLTYNYLLIIILIHLLINTHPTSGKLL